MRARGSPARPRRPPPPPRPARRPTPFLATPPQALARDVDVADAPTTSVPAVNGTPLNGAAVNGAATAGATPALNGATVVAPLAADATVTIDADEPVMGACEAGQLEACAVERVAALEAAPTPADPAPASAAARSPYAAPGGRWSSFKSYSALQRTLQIWTFALRFFVRFWLVGRAWTYPKKAGGMTEEAVSARRRTLAVWLREGLCRLGPTFIKVGQQFSTRVDVLSPEFVQELELLQDSVPPFDSGDAIATVERNLGAPIADLYESFDPAPIAAASLGQVHLATYKGERVVVKVQRPGLKQLFDIDLKNVRLLATWANAADPKSDGAARDWVAIYDECSRILYEEIDYTLEGRSADKFRKCFAGTDWVKVPRVLWDRSAPQVLTMEYAPGIKVNRAAELDAAGVDRTLIARRTVEAYLQQLLTHGFFHADPHPGNVAVDATDGRLIYYDFGMMGTIPGDVRQGLLELFYGVYEKDPDRCLDALVSMGVLVPGGDRVAVRRTAQFFLDQFQERLDAQRAEAASNPAYRDGFKGQATKDEKKAKRKQILSTIGEDLLLASADKPFRFPATFTFVVRSFTVLDGIGKSLDPRFDITEIAAPYARGLLLEAAPQAARARADFGKRLALQNRAVKNLFRGPNMIEDVARAMGALERGDLKPRVRALEAERALDRVAAMQRVTAAAVVASALVNVGTVCAVSAMAGAAAAAFSAAGAVGVVLLAAYAKVRKLEKKEAQIAGMA
jgi:predicted unusual protein kinase regulating ubiquinone biosynthesis (AarF/ABC1/UbiB family)